jgi:prepilin-type processing-associated H-X9-DG protein
MPDPDLKGLLFSEKCDRMMQLFVDGHAIVTPFVDGKIYQVLIS